jgi:hypothetical protein
LLLLLRIACLLHSRIGRAPPPAAPGLLLLLLLGFSGSSMLSSRCILSVGMRSVAAFLIT